MNPVEYRQVLGRRIAQERRRHGLSQPELAALLDRPVIWVSQLERGIQPIDGPTMLKTVADALDLPLAELTTSGQTASSSAGAATAGGAADSRPAVAEGLRVLLAGAHSLCAMLSERPAPPLAWLRTRTDRACTLAAAGRYRELTGVLGELMPGLEAAVRRTHSAEQGDAYELMAMAYQACAAALARLGETEAAWVAADRAMAAAERAGNLVLVAAGAHRLASVFLAARQYALAGATASTTIAALEGLASIGDPDAVALCGGLTLLRAAVAARSGRLNAAYGQLARARQLAARLDGYQAGGIPEFSPQCVALYEIAVSVDLGDAGHALRVAATADLTGLSPARRARMLIDVARAFALRQQVDRAVAALTEAEAIGASYVRGSSRVRQVVADLMALPGPPPTVLADLQARLGGSAAGR